ncbi:MAG: hypothetical protein JWR50_70 [Mucilaginibacter sp.]|nr:hypothetical protein [Mucilaginibacter sp.]
MKRLILLPGLLLLVGTALLAQVPVPKKLGTVQLTNMRAPSPVKIDGKLNEWNDNFQAYNKSTRLFYIIANDDKNLYLAVKATDFTTTAKIIAGGVTLAINKEGKKKEKDAYSFTFPVIENPQRLSGGLSNRIEQRNAGADSELMKTIHERTIMAAKVIKVLGVKAITDTLISIYNEHGIKAAINFDSDGITYELKVPLTLLDISVDEAKEMAYNIKLNGLQLNLGGGPGGGGGGGGGRNALDFQDLVSPSDFWARYTLAKQ